MRCLHRLGLYAVVGVSYVLARPRESCWANTGSSLTPSRAPSGVESRIALGQLVTCPVGAQGGIALVRRAEVGAVATESAIIGAAADLAGASRGAGLGLHRDDEEKQKAEEEGYSQGLVLLSHLGRGQPCVFNTWVKGMGGCLFGKETFAERQGMAFFYLIMIYEKFSISDIEHLLPTCNELVPQWVVITDITVLHNKQGQIPTSIQSLKVYATLPTILTHFTTKEHSLGWSADQARTQIAGFVQYC